MTFNTNSHRDIATGANGKNKQATPGHTTETPPRPNLEEILDITKGANGRYPAVAPGRAHPFINSAPSHPDLGEIGTLVEENPLLKKLYKMKEEVGIRTEKYDDLNAALHYAVEADWRKKQEVQRRNNQNPAGRETPQGGIGR